MIPAFDRLRRFLRQSRSQRQAADCLYRAAVSQARSPGFYREGCVPDTLDGRFDMVVLHVWLVMRSLKGLPDSAQLQRCLLEVAVADYDTSLREMGVGDLGVGRRVRSMARAQAGRFRAYDAAIAEVDNSELEAAISRNVWRGMPPDAKPVQALASYLRRQHLYLESQDPAVIARGEVRFLGFEVA